MMLVWTFRVMLKLGVGRKRFFVGGLEGVNLPHL
jgi:hypothetical protein